MNKVDDWKTKVIYQIYPKSFKDSNHDGLGDLNGIISKIDYLSNLGINMIWLTPIFKSPNKDNGYDVADYLEIDPAFGTLEEFEKLVALGTESNIGIMLDMVFNHTSDQHQWFQQSLNRNPVYDDFYIWRDGVKGQLPSDEVAFFGGSVWEYSEKRQQYYYHSFDKSQPDLNWANPQVRKSLSEVVNYWINKGIKGFRFDAIDNIGKVIGEKVTTDVNLTHQYLSELRANSFGKYSDVVTVGETGSADLANAMRYTNPDTKELDMIFQFELMNLDGIRNGDWQQRPVDLLEYKRIVKKWQEGLSGKGWNSQFFGNHDFPRIVSRFGSDASSDRILSSKMLATLLFALQGTPYIYQGDEIGMTNYPWESFEQFNDVESLNFIEIQKNKGLAEAEILERLKVNSRDNARTPMQWSSDQFAGFSDVKPWLGENPNYHSINVAESTQDPNSIYNFYKKLIEYKKEFQVFSDGDYHDLLPEDENIIAFKRENNQEVLTVICNWSNEKATIDLKSIDLSFDKLLISNYQIEKDCLSFNQSVILRPFEAMILYKKKGEKHE
ncbi:alpha,alpha-phosphotrehalase [Enterococcus cecorum]|uniref:Alpha,alpha-phosphotrehalase n=3 Tax=Enterococcus cecorum TaxID=44008 RepID=A0AAW9JPD4_9ENTE|nr:alpha,alpha-phosphotrehalase [Enterococcus cecorum]MDZ5440934.1 alpha,alpha-phosphotrehalase [Enterococcus cecorum]MDZ5498967.1 alpha,alpha-phosphotrehalase [Enterococcus cecorum]MDZ5501053.1 alpha,alpha-phosphotrehalase [Enterococcus cecorum]MDZ5505215.1 alpha,alpha-phosphotrehalase [Enterococcus cecorum]MDZ5532669.1 alpha,alpha-phosphotrehalase [Enterococcus cecorum]